MSINVTCNHLLILEVKSTNVSKRDVNHLLLLQVTSTNVSERDVNHLLVLDVQQLDLLLPLNEVEDRGDVRLGWRNFVDLLLRLSHEVHLLDFRGRKAGTLQPEEGFDAPAEDRGCRLI
jgi:hypothetical protein